MHFTMAPSRWRCLQLGRVERKRTVVTWGAPFPPLNVVLIRAANQKKFNVDIHSSHAT